MSFRINGLSPAPFQPLFGLSDEALSDKGVIRVTADAKPGFPCRITLEDAEPGEAVLLLNHESHGAETPYRSSYAIYVRESASAPAEYVDDIPPILKGRPLALRLFDRKGMLAGAELSLDGDPRRIIEQALERTGVAYIDVHNAAHGCFAARVTRNQTAPG